MTTRKNKKSTIKLVRSFIRVGDHVPVKVDVERVVKVAKIVSAQSRWDEAHYEGTDQNGDVVFFTDADIIPR